MAKFELKLPKMGESVAEATITSWLKEVGDTIELDEVVLEIATDKVDSEVPSEVDGVLLEKRFNVDDVVQVGQVIAIIETDGDDADEEAPVNEEALKETEAVEYVEKDSELWVDILSQERMQGQFVMDASIGKSLRIKDKKDKYHYLNFNLNVGNITNNTKFVTGGFEQSRFDFTDKDLTKFQTKYFYSYGLNFFAGFSYRF